MVPRKGLRLRCAKQLFRNGYLLSSKAFVYHLRAPANSDYRRGQDAMLVPVPDSQSKAGGYPFER
jgi:hypothetical protein